MTKMKSKKMTKSTFAIVIMAIVMVAMLAFGGTYAYFTATADAKLVPGAKTAKVTLANATEIDEVTYETIVPGESTAGTAIKLTTASTTETYVFVTLTAVVLSESDEEIELFVQDASDAFVPVLSIAKTADSWKAVMNGEDAVANTYYFATTSDELTTIDDFSYTIKFSEYVQANYDETSGETHNVYRAATEDDTDTDNDGYVVYEGDIMDIELKVSVTASAIQQYGYAQADVTAGTYSSLDGAIAAAYTASTASVETR